MKLLTLNSHSLEEADYERKLKEFQQAVLLERPQVIALQEVNQRMLPGDSVPPSVLAQCGYTPCPPVPGTAQPSIREDNHALRLARHFTEQGLPFHWTWTPSKIGYDKYDEGLALFSLMPIVSVHTFYITESRDYFNWKTRKILGITTETDQGPQHFFTVHMGWWNDPEEPFAKQWNSITQELTSLKTEPVWLMGDFNSPSHLPDQGYDLIRSSGWLDTYLLAEIRDQGFTVSKTIDGWKEDGEIAGMRIDYIWTNRPVPVKYSKTIFNDTFYPAVSDHSGILIEL